MLRSMKCLLSLTAILLLAHTSNAEKRTVTCKTPAIAASCYQTHGRLAVANGAVNWRLWKIGTHDILGIYSGPSSYAHAWETLDTEHPQMPHNLARYYEDAKNPFGPLIYADFQVCPLEPHIPGHMQAACIESATHLVVKK